MDKHNRKDWIIIRSQEERTVQKSQKNSTMITCLRLRQILNVICRDHHKNSDIRTKLDVKDDIVEKTTVKRLRYFGHVMQMDNFRLPNIALYGRVEGYRAKGRPRKRWLDNVIEDCKHCSCSIIEVTRTANNRLHWRTSIRLSQRATASP